MIIRGDCLEKLKTLEANSIDSIVTDPPYGLSFMGKKWDYDVPSVEIWREVIRVLKPGGHLLSFGGTRTHHRMVLAIEDAGFEIRDQIQWLYGSGFPKSHDISKAIDKAAGAEREVVGNNPNHRGQSQFENQYTKGLGQDGSITAPSTPEAKQWQGWGTALKPANEPIVLARKPLEKGLTIAENVLKWGCGGLNIDASRIEGGERPHIERRNDKSLDGDVYGSGINGSKSLGLFTQGRFPANLLLDETAAEMLDEQSGVLKTGGPKYEDSHQKHHMFKGGRPDSHRPGDTGGASRFFYVAKASKRERGEGNVHPTVKPIRLIEYLIKLITPPNGTVLDPFMGSGSTGVAAKNLGFEFIGIELNDEYCEIAQKRIDAIT